MRLLLPVPNSVWTADSGILLHVDIDLHLAGSLLLWVTLWPTYTFKSYIAQKHLHPLAERYMHVSRDDVTLKLSKPAKQVWYWALRVYWERFRVYVCVYVCMWSNSSQTTEPICIKIIPANRAFYADCYRLLRFEIFTKYDEYFLIERTPFLNKHSFATAP